MTRSFAEKERLDVNVMRIHVNNMLEKRDSVSMWDCMLRSPTRYFWQDELCVKRLVSSGELKEIGGGVFIKGSPYIGVVKVKRVLPESKCFVAKIVHRDRSYHIGTYKTAKEAAKAYDQRAFQLRGEGAKLNFPKDTKND